MTKQLSAANQAALAAGALLRQEYGKPHRVELKGPTNLVTEVDQCSQELILGMLTSSFPDYSVLGEEGIDKQASGYPRWGIDPLDGEPFVLGGPATA